MLTIHFDDPAVIADPYPSLHALQDREVSLDSFMVPHPGQGDQVLARQARRGGERGDRPAVERPVQDHDLGLVDAEAVRMLTGQLQRALVGLQP